MDPELTRIEQYWLEDPQETELLLEKRERNRLARADDMEDDDE